ncbi:MAG: methyltransferase [Desulfonauticus sp.]|nr:methyltransferase [Desulfonauticus sp.]
MELYIEKLIWRGRGLAKSKDGQIILVDPPVFPKERVQVNLHTVKKDYAQAKVISILTSHPDRRKHPCPYAGTCGGCSFGHIKAKQALKLKYSILQDALSRSKLRSICQHVPVQVINAAKSWRYRYRGQIFIQNGLPCLKKMSSRQNIPISDCLLFIKQLGTNLKTLASSKKNGKYTVISNGNQVAIAGDNKILDFKLTAFPLTFFFSADHFFQANWHLNQKLIEIVCNNLKHEEKIIDLYAGAGNFALPLAWLKKKVLALEQNKASITLGQQTAALHGLKVQFHQANLNQNCDLIHQFQPEAVVIDPPRSGAPFLKHILKQTHLKKIIWVSCDIVNSLRDITPFVLDHGYQVEKLFLLDMFPQTWHFEVVFVLKAKKQLSP